MEKQVMIKFSKRLIKLLNRMMDEYDSVIAYELQWMSTSNSKYENIFRLSPFIKNLLRFHLIT